MKSSGTNFWVRFGVFFWVITLVYWVIALPGGAFFVGIPSDSSTNPSGCAIPPATWTIPGNILGLFVPVGPSNALFLIIGLFSGWRAWIALVLVIFVLYFAERLLRKLNLNIILKILANLGILLLLTMATDYVMFSKWASFEILNTSVEYANDQYGETTPDATIVDFTKSLEHLDTQTAVKYFELQHQQSANEFFAKLSSTSTLELAADLGKLKVRSSSQDSMAYILRDSSGEVVVGMFLDRNSKNIWKISYLLFNNQETTL